MAKLSARGRTELCRMQATEDCGGKDGLSSIEVTVVLMSDGAVLRKHKWLRTDGSSHASGWGVLSRQTGTWDVVRFREAYKRNGFQEVGS